MNKKELSYYADGSEVYEERLKRIKRRLKGIEDVTVDDDTLPLERMRYVSKGHHVDPYVWKETFVVDGQEVFPAVTVYDLENNTGTVFKLVGNISQEDVKKVLDYNPLGVKHVWSAKEKKELYPDELDPSDWVIMGKRRD